MKQMVKGSAALTGVSLAEMVMRFVRTKCIALFLGPVGTGVLAQLNIFFELLRVWGDLGSRRGVIKQIAEQRNSGKNGGKYGEIIKTSYFLAAAASGLTGLGVAVFSPLISKSLFGSASYYPYIIALAFLLPVASISTVTASIVKGNLEYSSFAKYTFGSYIGVMAVTPVLVYFFHYWGALSAMALFFLFPFISYLIFNRKSKFLVFSKKIDFAALWEQFSYGFVQIYQDSMGQFARVLVSAWIIKALGLHVMGIYQVIITFSTIYLSIPIQAMSGYAMPIMASAANNKDVTRSINDSLRFLLFLLVPAVALIMVWPEIFIYLFFSSDFMSAAVPLQIQLLGTLFVLMAYPYFVAFQARGQLKGLAIISTLQPVAYLAFVWLFFGLGQLSGIAAAYAVATGISLVVQHFMARHYYSMHIVPKNQRLLIATFCWIGICFLAGAVYHGVVFRLIASFMIIPWFLVSSKKHEREFLLSKWNSLKELRKFSFKSGVKSLRL